MALIVYFGIGALLWIYAHDYVSKQNHSKLFFSNLKWFLILYLTMIAFMFYANYYEIADESRETRHGVVLLMFLTLILPFIWSVALIVYSFFNSDKRISKQKVSDQDILDDNFFDKKR